METFASGDAGGERSLQVGPDGCMYVGRNPGIRYDNDVNSYDASSITRICGGFFIPPGVGGGGGGGDDDLVGPITSNLVKTPEPAPVGQQVLLTADVDDTTTGESNIASAEYSIDGSPSPGTPMAATDGSFDAVTENVTAILPAFTEVGVYDVCVNGTDAEGNQGTNACALLAVYDPDAGYVTGVGSIISEPGSLIADGTLTGKATFGFVSKYKRGATTPSGRTTFRFRVADFQFQSDSYLWLVVSGAKAIYKGTGAINGEGNYGFLLTARDGALPGGGGVDGFRIKIWDIDDADTLIYDNTVGDPDDLTAGLQDIASGHIVIRTRKN